MKRKTLRLIALSLCVVLMAAAVVDTAPVSAYAVTQTEIDALKAERDAVKAQRQEKQAIVEQLEAGLRDLGVDGAGHIAYLFCAAASVHEGAAHLGEKVVAVECCARSVCYKH